MSAGREGPSFPGLRVLVGDTIGRHRGFLVVVYALLVLGTGAACVAEELSDDADEGLEYLVPAVMAYLLPFVILYGGGPIAWKPKRPWGIQAFLAARPQLRAVVRWFLVVPAFSLLTGLYVMGVVMSFLFMTSWLGDYGIDRNLAPGFLGSFDLGFVLGGIFAGAGFLAAIVVAVRLPRLPALRWLVGFSVWTGGYLALLLLSQVALRYVSPQLSQAAADNMKGILLVILSFTGALGAGLRLMFLSTPETPPTVPPGRGEPVKSDRSLSSARTLSIGLIVLGYVTLDVTIDYGAGMARLLEAREAFASYHLLSRETGKARIAGVGSVEVRERVEHGFISDTTVTYVRVERPNGRVWVAQKKIDTKEACEERLDQLAWELDLDRKSGEPFNTLFRRVERRVFNQKDVALPVVGLPVQASHVTWMAALLSLVLLVLIRNRMRRCFRDPDLGREEPWLILDGESKMEYGVSRIWELLLFLVPSAVHAALMITLAIEIAAEGAQSSFAWDSLRFLFLAGIWVTGVRVAAQIVLELHLLRRMRTER